MQSDEFGFLDMFVVALMISAIVGSFISLIITILHYTAGWPHGLGMAYAVCYAIPFLVVVGLGAGDD